jgi:hypothetical protein
MKNTPLIVISVLIVVILLVASGAAGWFRRLDRSSPADPPAGQSQPAASESPQPGEADAVEVVPLQPPGESENGGTQAAGDPGEPADPPTSVPASQAEPFPPPLVPDTSDEGEAGEGPQEVYTTPVQVESTSGTSAPTLDPLEPRRFTKDGQPWYPVGYYASIAALTADQTDYAAYYRELFDTLAEHGINYTRAVFTMGQPYGDAMDPYLRTGPGEAADGKPRFDLERFNPDYFSYWREVIEYAGSRGIVIQLTIFDSWHNKRSVVQPGRPGMEWGMRYDYYRGENNISGIDAGSPAQWHDPYHPVFEVQQALLRQVVDTLGDLPNLVYEIANENYTSQEWELALADYLSEYEASRSLPAHLVMPRDLPNHDHAGGKDMDPANTRRELLDNHAINQPLIADNDGGGEGSPAVRRQKAWAALTAGAHISYFHFDIFRLDALRSQDAAQGMRYLGYLGKFVEEWVGDLRGMVPADHLVSRGWAYAEPGERWLVYLPQGGETTIHDLAPPVQAIWYNPRSGESLRVNITGATFRSLTGEDWVLWVWRE